jgi:hypothetical protein
MSAATRLLLLLLMMMVLTRTVHCQDAQQIADRLWLGSCEASHNQSFVESEAIALIVTVTPAAECSQPLAGIVKYVRVDLLDDGSHALRPFLPLVQREIDAALVANRSVLLHCVQGISRSPAVAMAYLMLSRDWSLRTALSAVRDARPSVQPRFQLFDELLTLERDCLDTIRCDTMPTTCRLSWRRPTSCNSAPLLAAVPVDRPSTAVSVQMIESDLLAGSHVQQYLLYERTHVLHSAKRDVVCTDCVTTESTSSVLRWWPRCPVRDEQPSIEPESTDASRCSSNRRLFCSPTTSGMARLAKCGAPPTKITRQSFSSACLPATRGARVRSARFSLADDSLACQTSHSLSTRSPPTTTSCFWCLTITGNRSTIWFMLRRHRTPTQVLSGLN